MPEKNGQLSTAGTRRPSDVAERERVSIAQLCRWFGVARSSFYYAPEDPKEPVIDAALSEEIRKFCGLDGWCHLTAIIDCWDRTIVGWRLSKTGVAKVAAAALEEALRGRGIDATANDLTLRSDNGLVFGAKPFVAVVRRYGLDQEYITPYTPEQNGMIERFFGSLEAECVWLHRFQDRDQAFAVIGRWIDKYHDERPHSALGYLTPNEYREKLAA